MKIIIAGAGAVGTHLAKLLSRENHDITLMDESPEKLEDISSNLDILTLPLPPSSISALQEAEVGNADLFIGVTPDEAHNMTACMLASKLGAKKTVARVDNFEYTLPQHREFSKRWASAPSSTPKCWLDRKYCTTSSAAGYANGGKCRTAPSFCSA